MKVIYVLLLCCCAAASAQTCVEEVASVERKIEAMELPITVLRTVSLAAPGFKNFALLDTVTLAMAKLTTTTTTVDCLGRHMRRAAEKYAIE